MEQALWLVEPIYRAIKNSERVDLKLSAALRIIFHLKVTFDQDYYQDVREVINNR